VVALRAVAESREDWRVLGQLELRVRVVLRVSLRLPLALVGRPSPVGGSAGVAAPCH
jgi:hypothetical protein